MKVFDCFTFYNEFELLELRLESLYNVVDYFVIVESNKTHTNKPKKFNFLEKKDEFKKFFPKIRYIMEEDEVPYKGIGDWSIENNQRNNIMKGLIDAEQEDLVFISDLDEFPKPDILTRLNNRQDILISQYTPIPAACGGKRIIIPCRLMVHAIDLLEYIPISMNQNRHDYYFNWICKETWQGTILTKYKNLTIPQNLRNLRTALPRVLEGGWHFSWMGGIDKVIDKMTSIVDGNEIVQKSNDKLTDKQYVKESMMNGTDIYKIRSQMLPYDIKNIDLPYLQTFVTKYPHFLKS